MFIHLFWRDVGFSGKTPAVIRHALRLIEDDVIVTSSREDSEKIHVHPKLAVPHVLNLAFYSNQVNEQTDFNVSP